MTDQLIIDFHDPN